jgi:hypothetical protein
MLNVLRGFTAKYRRVAPHFQRAEKVASPGARGFEKVVDE